MSREGHTALIVGQEVADQIVCDMLRSRAREVNAEERRRREADRSSVEQNGASPDSDGPSDPVDSAEAEARARAEREAEVERRRAAARFNEQLGSSIVKHLSRLPVDERLVPILTAVDIARDLERVAMRGARYGFPGWFEGHDDLARRRYIEKRVDAADRAREYLAGAESAEDVAGRTFALMTMAILADEAAVAPSNRVGNPVVVVGTVPWAEQVPELIDAVLAEKLPKQLVAERLADRAEKRAAAAAAREHAAEVDADLEAGIAEVDTVDLNELAAAIAGAEALGGYDFRRDERLRISRAALERRRATTPKAPDPADEGSGTDGR